MSDETPKTTPQIIEEDKLDEVAGGLVLSSGKQTTAAAQIAAATAESDAQKQKATNEYYVARVEALTTPIAMGKN